MFDKHRFEIWTPAQHPLKHTLSDFGYTNPALPGVTDVNSALNWVFKVLYPRTQPSVATHADLPATGNTLNDYRVVLDDGDGKQAGYRWEQREGDVAASWYKIFDFDWSTDSILASFIDITQDLYVYQKGKSDLNPDGTVRTGIYAGQLIFGGNQPNQNMTLAANSGDGTGAKTGYIQFEDNVRPTITGSVDLGTNALRFGSIHLAVGAYINTMTILGGSIIDSGGQIDFGDNNLITTGYVQANDLFAVSSISVGLTGAFLTLASGSITDESGAIDFDNENLSTTGTITGGSGSKFGDITITNGNIVSSGGEIDFGGNDLGSIGTISATTLSAGTLVAGNIVISGDTISNTITNNNIILATMGTGIIDVQAPMTTLGQTITGIVGITGQLNIDNIRLDLNAISTTNLNGDLTLSPNGTGNILVSTNIVPSADASYELGSPVARFVNAYISNSIHDGSNPFFMTDLMSLRNLNVGVTNGMSLFYNSGSGYWEPSLPDTEIDHRTIGHLADSATDDAGHTQFVILAGRAGGQIIQGGVAASEHLILESTSHATKGKVKTKDSFVSFSAPVYSGGWTGNDLGATSAEFRNLYTKGELIGARLENVLSSALPSASGQNIGRSVWATDINRIYVDIGGSWQVVGAGKYLSDTTWDGVQTTQTFTVSASIVDARTAIWAIHDNANDFEQVFCVIKAISATQVQVDVSPALPAGSYRLIGLE